MELDVNIILLLIGTGILVGVINTFAGAAAAISISIFMALGLPITVANGTNRIPVFAQTLVMSVNFARQGILDYKTGLLLGIPTVVGSIIGSLFASQVNVKIFTYILTVVLLVLLVVLVFNPSKFTSTASNVRAREIKLRDYLCFFVIGLYGGAIHIGVGYLILTATIMGMGYDVLTANAIKGFVVLLYIPFALGVFMYNDQVMYSYGLIHAVGNVIGAFFATQYATRIRASYIRWLLIAMIVVTVLDLHKVIDIQKFVFYILSL